jgi:high-affinity nickel-transport protein
MTTTEPLSRLRLGRKEWLAIGSMSGFILFLHILGWGLLLGAVASQQFDLGSAGVFGVGLGVTAYTLGLRHAFDADHLVAIDNITRKLMTDGKKPVTVGFWFSLGHSTVVFGLCFLLALGVRALATQIIDSESTLQNATNFIGMAVSGTFLISIAIINLIILRNVIAIFRDLRSGSYDEIKLEEELAKRGFINQMLGKINKTVSKPWHVYPIGILFGLGFDTATEVTLLILAGGAAAFALPWYAILVLPLLFAAGMILLDSIDGTFMNFAYSWAFLKPVRKIYYNIVITALSIILAFVIGSIEILSILVKKLGIDSGILYWIANIDLENVGYIILILFVIVWVTAILIWRFGRIEERWSPTDDLEAQAPNFTVT